MTGLLNNWIACGLGAAISFAGMALSLKKVSTFGIHPLAINFYLVLFTCLGFGSWVKYSKISLSISFEVLLFLVIASTFALAGNYFDVLSLSKAPNPGYAGVLKAGQIIIITSLSPFLFDSSFSFVKALGIALVIGGMLLVSS